MRTVPCWGGRERRLSRKVNAASNRPARYIEIAAKPRSVRSGLGTAAWLFFHPRRRLILDLRDGGGWVCSASWPSRSSLPNGAHRWNSSLGLLEFLDGRAHAASQLRQFLRPEKNEDKQQNNDQIRSAEVGQQREHAHGAKHLPIPGTCKAFRGWERHARVPRWVA